ncbi:hypothetical protein ABZP36_014018 [Zizania latifolia]
MVELLIHLDQVEDWSPTLLHSPGSQASRMPSPISSESSDSPFSRVHSFLWYLGYEDGTLPSSALPPKKWGVRLVGLQLSCRLNFDDNSSNKEDDDHHEEGGEGLASGQRS